MLLENVEHGFLCIFGRQAESINSVLVTIRDKIVWRVKGCLQDHNGMKQCETHSKRTKDAVRRFNTLTDSLWVFEVLLDTSCFLRFLCFEMEIEMREMRPPAFLKTEQCLLS